MSIRRWFPMTLAACTVVACTGEVSSPLTPETPLVTAQDAGQEHRVVGSGHVQTDAGQREFTFHAVETPVGGVSGSYKIQLPNGLFFEADVTCLAVEGDTGWVAGTIRDTNAGIVEVGSRSMFFVIDNGEGGGAADKVSLAAFNMPEGTDLEFCEEKPLLLLELTVTDGNVQVR